MKGFVRRATIVFSTGGKYCPPPPAEPPIGVKPILVDARRSCSAEVV